MKLLRNLDTRISKTGRKESWGEFLCEFDNKIVERRLSNGIRDKSCGCQKNELIKQGNIKHDEINTRLYNTWSNMKQRILNPNVDCYKDYGGRGITVCNDWVEFIPFRDWALNNGYEEGLEIDRRNTNRNYEPNNCRFITKIENLRNTRRNVIKNMEIANEIRYLYSTGNYTQKELAKKFGVNQDTISDIINNKIWKNK